MSIDSKETFVSLQDWSKAVRAALPYKETNLQKVSESIGYCYATVTALISGRIVKQNYLDIARKINEQLGVAVLPMKPELPSAEWCADVRSKLYVQGKNIGQLAKETGFNRDRLSLVLNGHTMDRPVIDEINKALKIETPVSLIGSESIIAESRVEKNGE